MSQSPPNSPGEDEEKELGQKSPVGDDNEENLKSPKVGQVGSSTIELNTPADKDSSSARSNSAVLLDKLREKSTSTDNHGSEDLDKSKHSRRPTESKSRSGFRSRSKIGSLVILVLIKISEQNQGVEIIHLVRDMEKPRGKGPEAQIRRRVTDTEGMIKIALTVLHLRVIWVSWLQEVNHKGGNRLEAVLHLRVIWVPLNRDRNLGKKPRRSHTFG
jgi:hypothetical protein